MEIRTKAVVFYEKGIRSAREIGETCNISERTVRRWGKSHRQDKEKGLRPKKTRPKRSSRATSPSLEQRIILLKEKYPAWGARRIKHQFNLPCSWRTVHRILKKHGLLIRITAKPPGNTVPSPLQRQETRCAAVSTVRRFLCHMGRIGVILPTIHEVEKKFKNPVVIDTVAYPWN